VAVVLTTANFALAAADLGLDQAAGTGLSAVSDPRVIAANIIRIFLGFLGIIAVGLIIYAGWLYMTAEGEQEKVEKAKKILIGAVIGLVICLASFAIASFILNRLSGATGISGDNNPPPPCVGTNCFGGGENSDGLPDLPTEGQACLKDALDSQCAAGVCAAGLSCAPASCTCQKESRPAEGESCDGDLAVQGCQAVECSDNLVCSAADNCSCIKTPLVAWVSPIDADKNPNGAPGNFITIGGRYFGAAIGKVTFLGNPADASDDQDAVSPATVNPACANFWQDNQIVVAIPAGAKTGPLKVADAAGLYDTTDNSRGAAINDFQINSIKRPGLCLADPVYGAPVDPFGLQGNAFNGAARAVLFGTETSFIPANGLNWNTNNLAVAATVPNIRDGRNSVYVKVDNLSSNDLGFTVRSNAATAPTIEYLEPAEGPVGQYLTIYGRNFKTYEAGKSAVKFYSPADPANLILADIDFPEACKNNWWHDKYIIVKAPLAELGDYKVVVITNQGRQSAPADFKIISGNPGPGLCSLEPHNGPVGQAVAASGNNFGSSKGDNGRVVFYDNQNGAISSWVNQLINASVPSGAQTGPFKVVNNNSKISNSLPFSVGKCSSTTDDCNSGEECCGAGTVWDGICRTAGTCSLGGARSCAFGWAFKTSQKQAGDSCYDGATAGTCDLSKANCGPNLTCDQSSCVCKLPCNSDLNNNQATCAPDQNKCAGTANPVCNLTTCLCECTKDSDCKNFGEFCNIATGTCQPGTPIESCSGYGDQCSNSYFCPNSPGKCSGNPGSTDTGVACGNAVCENLDKCQGGLCEYSAAINRCKKIDATCDLPKTVNNINNNQVELICGTVDNKNIWYYASNQTCADGYTKSIDKTKCLGEPCDICAAGFSCAKENNAGVCVAGQGICPTGSNCVVGQCKKTAQPSCECCCQISQNTATGNPGCCTGLTCGGTCGADSSLTDGPDTDEDGIGDSNAGQGKCTGCTVKDANGNINQAASNAKCNCTGTSGKFCATGEAGGLGACLDCASLTGPDECSTKGAGSCCVDAEKNNACRGGNGAATVKSVYAGDQNNYCAYYTCATGGKTCNANPIASSTAQVYATKAICDNKCSSVTLPGTTCDAQATTTPTCSQNNCATLSCLNADGSGPTPPNSCGTCCCDPANDQCAAPLKCVADKGACSGAGRGLCCGCSTDSQCGDSLSAGCGTDTCCTARPSVISILPANQATGICRNSLIEATFSKPMRISSLSANVIVAGDYTDKPCPAGTKLLTAAYNPSWLEKLKLWLARLPLADKFFASPARAEAVGNFCVIPGQISGSLISNGTQTKLEFKPSQLLGAGTTYYVIIKGESDLTDAAHDGVLSQDGLGLNPVNQETFNGVIYKGKIWQFTTKANSAASGGACQIAAVRVNPSGYLFNTVINNPDDDSDPVLDLTTGDSDKLFTAKAYSMENQPITPTTGYNWRWDWWIDDPTVVKFKNNGVVSETALDDKAEQTIVAENVQEARTLLHAKATVNLDSMNKPSTVGSFKEGTASIQVFQCANFWPAFKTDKVTGYQIWEPWRDDGSNCNVGAGTCYDTNYELYYCRDAGGPGEADDLPAIQSDSAVIRPYSTEQNIIKEIYYFREGQ